MASQQHTYFTIPFELVPQDPPYKVWFASWTAVKPRLNSQTEPRPFVIGVTSDTVPPGATLLGTGRRSPSSAPPPPPPPTVGLASYQTAIATWLQAGTDAQDYSYYMISFDAIPEHRVDARLWFATWSTMRPAIASGALPPLVVGVISTPAVPDARAGDGRSAASPTAVARAAVPLGGDLLTNATKDPQIPPPAAPPPGTSLDGHRVWLDERSVE
jgi:hypothetical protein